MGKIETEEIELITGEHLMSASFQLNYREWCSLSKKRYWRKLHRFLLEGGEKTVEVYKNLRGEMVKKEISNNDLAVLLNVHPSTIGNKFNNRGGSDFTISEAVLIKETFFQGMDVEELFSKKIAP